MGKHGTGEHRMNCPKCGSENPPDVQLCSFCGVIFARA
ncbi:MAG: zinc-ribbon domain-containing protein [Phycisphaerales bacterium]|nr:MAG: zinc-ribbon domain-containing protein [Phycisphaerales bacterium]